MEDGINFTAGLDVVRTSPDHGTAMDIAGKNNADAASFSAAIFDAIKILENQQIDLGKPTKSIEEIQDLYGRR